MLLFIATILQLNMGNKICCDQSHQKPTELERLEEEVVQKINVVDVHPKNEDLPPSAEEEKLESAVHHSHLHHHDHHHEHTSPAGTQVEIPQLWPRVKEVVDSHHFFEQELAKLNGQRRRYGEDVYEGQLDEEGVKPNGLGRMYKEDGSHYVGYFSHGRAHGRGVFIFHNGSFYNGEFNHNKAETSSDSEGRYESPAVKYVGGFSNNTFHGHGVETGEGYRFEGQYANGVRKEGHFTWHAADGEYSYKGTFNENNKFHGKGVLTEPHGTYEGDFLNGNKHGEGFYKAKNGTKYRGQYANNERNGKGTVFNSDDSIAYEGEIKNGLPHGKGKVKTAEGFVEANWNEGIDVSLIQE